MSDKVFWPGQIPDQELTLEQLKVGTPSSRSDVFWAYRAEEPLSVTEASKIIGKSPQAVRYHTNELLKVGMLIVVGTRKRRSRTEELYVWKSVSIHTKSAPYSAEYSAVKRRGFQSQWRQLDRDRAATNAIENLDPSIGPLSDYTRVSVTLKKDDLLRFRQRAHELLAEFVALNSEEGIRTSLLIFSCPVFGESEREYRRLTGRSLRSDLRSELDQDNAEE